jgi:hypothetical protein
MDWGDICPDILPFTFTWFKVQTPHPHSLCIGSSLSTFFKIEKKKKLAKPSDNFICYYMYFS